METLIKETVNTQAILTTAAVTVAYAHPTPRVTDVWACAGVEPDLFFPEDDTTLATALALCGSCGFRQTCLDLATARKESGVWGGVLLEDGKALPGIKKPGRPAKANAA